VSHLFSHAGATNPNTLRQLIKEGARVEFVDSLHMKVYWAKARGAVITSANLSTNAMGAGGLKEAGVLLGPKALNMARMLMQLKRRRAEPELRKLDRLHKEFHRRVGWKGPHRSTRSYADWFDSPERERWKIFFYSTTSFDLSEAATQEIQRDFNKKAQEWIWSESPKVAENDWILSGYSSRGRLVKLNWMFTDRVFRVPRSDPNYDRDFPYEVIQIHGLKHYPPPPFLIGHRVRQCLNNVLQKKIESETGTPYELRSKDLRAIYDSLHPAEPPQTPRRR
jgi:hypothetical protein